MTASILDTLGRGRADLTRMRALLRHLGDPQRQFPSVHVTGTNGKTSITRVTAALLTAHGHRTGAFTSPHLQHPAERIRVDGAPIGDHELDTLLTKVTSHHESPGVAAPTFFETMTATAFLHFVQSAVDEAVLEVGIGGACDATNVVAAPVAVLGPIGLDHPELGADVRSIAEHKAGIIADGATVIVAPQHPAAMAVIDRVARERGARLLRFARDITVDRRRRVRDGQRFRIGLPGGVRITVGLSSAAPYQAMNVALAAAAAQVRLGRLDPGRVRGALRRFGFPGRGELVRLPGSVPVLLDGAHNRPAAERLAASVIWPGPVTMVVGMMSGKDVGGVASALSHVADRFVVTPAGGPGTADPREVATEFRLSGRTVHIRDDVAGAIRTARTVTGADGLIVVTGSLYTVGAARDVLGLPWSPG